MITLIDDRHAECNGNQSSQENYAAPIFIDFVGKNSLISSLLEFAPSDLSQVKCNSTLTARGEGRGDQFEISALHSTNFAGVEFATMSSARSGSGPDLNILVASANMHIPFSAEVLNIDPSNLRLQHGIGDDHSFIANLNFGLDEAEIQEGQRCSNPENCCDEIFYASNAEARPQGEEREQRANSGEGITASSSKSLGVIHTVIFSQRTISADRMAL